MSKRRPFVFTSSVPPEAEELPGVWKNKSGSGYRVPYNAHEAIGWELNHHDWSGDLAVEAALKSTWLLGDMNDFAKPHQKRMLAKALAVTGSHGWAPPGAGKTLVGLVYACSVAPRGVKLVITKAAARGTWKEQCERYTRLKPVLLLGQGGRVPEGGWRSDCLYITAWETIKYWQKVLVKAELGVTVWDEIHWLRRPKHTRATVLEDGSVRFDGLNNSLDSARKVAGASPRSLGLTATPIPGRVRDLWTQLDLVEPWQWGSFHMFGMRYCQGTHNGYGYQYLGLTNPHELKKRLGYVKVRVKREEVDQHLPKKRREVIRLEVAQQDKPVAMKRDIARATKDAKSGGEDAAGAYFETLLMEAATRKYSYVIDRVYDALKNAQKVVVFTGRRLDCERLGKKLQKKVEEIKGCDVWVAHGGTDTSDRDIIRTKYMSHPGPALLVGTGDAWGESVDLQDTDLAIISMLPWTPDKVIQWEGRFSRLGQKRPVLVSYIIARTTVDEHVADLLLEKLPHVGEIAEDLAAEEIEGALGGVDESEGAQGRLLDRISNMVSLIGT